MPYTLKLLRPWIVAHRGAPPHEYSAGVYEVPDEMSEELAHRALRDGRGVVADEERVEPKPKRGRRLATRMLRQAPENKAV